MTAFIVERDYAGFSRSPKLDKLGKPLHLAEIFYAKTVVCIITSLTGGEKQLVTA